MSLKHIIGHVYAHRGNVAKIEGFEQTLMIRVTLKDGCVFERFVSEERMQDHTSEEGYRRRVEAKKRHIAEMRSLYARSDMAYTPTNHEVKRYNREEAFQIELQHFINYINE